MDALIKKKGVKKKKILSVYVDDVKLAGKTENFESTWKILMEDVDLGEPTSFFDPDFCWCQGKTTNKSFRET